MFLPNHVISPVSQIILLSQNFIQISSPGKNTRVGCHSLLQGIFPDPGIKPRSPALQADSLAAELPGPPRASCYNHYIIILVAKLFPIVLG